jgi:hypothetical protein
MKGEVRKLLELFGRLGEERQDRLIAFAEFLSAGAPEKGGAREPLVIPRPVSESVALAIRRLVRTYPMLDRRRLMGEASRFLAQHALDGRAESEVIDELEVLFVRHHEQHKAKGESRKEKG